MKVLLAADDSGSLKEVICKRGTDTSVQAATQPESINTVCEGSRQTKIQQFIIFKNYLIAARSQGSICFYDLDNEYALVKTFEKCSASPKDSFISLLESFGLIYACTEAGVVSVINPANLNGEAKHLSVNIKAPVSTFISHPLQRGVFAYGGKENDVKIVSLFENVKDEELARNLKEKVLFQAKNVKNDQLDLRVPIWVSKLIFIDATVKRGSWSLIAVTRYGQIRLYNTLHGRKPVSNIKISEKPLVTLANTSEPSEVICSDTHTTTLRFNIKKGLLLGKYKGAVGSIQALHTFLEGDLLATGGLDRYLRVFDLDSREQVAKVYVGSQISCVQVIEDDEEEEEVQEKQSKRKREEESESDVEEMWNQLDANSKPKVQRK